MFSNEQNMEQAEPSKPDIPQILRCRKNDRGRGLQLPHHAKTMRAVSSNNNRN